MTLQIVPADPKAPDVAALIETHVAYGNANYPEESNHHLSPEDYATADTRLFAARKDGECLGMVGIKTLSDGTAEVKSMHVRAEGRGAGIGEALMIHILTLAKAEGVRALFLETGSREASAAARRLYERHGFTYCPPFADYAPDPESVFMRRVL